MKNPGIWENYNCERCGACCYEFIEKEGDCGYFEIKDNKANCKNHEGERPWVCDLFFCSMLEGSSERERKELREEYRQLAIKLGTVPSSFLDNS